ATTASSRKQELLEEIASLKEKLSKSEHGIIRYRRKTETEGVQIGGEY
ncbi:3680_t:CDS:2, partial [Funneliformis caledonium]